MVRAIKKEFVLDKYGKPVKCFTYLAGVGDTLPQNAPVGSRAIFENGTSALRTPEGWKMRGSENG